MFLVKKQRVINLLVGKRGHASTAQMRAQLNVPIVHSNKAALSLTPSQLQAWAMLIGANPPSAAKLRPDIKRPNAYSCRVVDLLVGAQRWLFVGTCLSAPLLYGSTRTWTINVLLIQLYAILSLWVLTLCVTRRKPALPLLVLLASGF